MEWYYWALIGLAVVYTLIGLIGFTMEYAILTVGINPNGGNKKLPPEFVRRLKLKHLFWPFSI